MSTKNIFTVGGTVQAHGGRYVSRKVDGQLLASCLKHEFAYVLAARQMGKSSLMVRTAERLREEGVRPVIVDLSQIGVQVTAEAWYLGFLSAVESGLGLDQDTFDWWDENAQLGFAQRLAKFFSDVVMKEIETGVVVFIDEIDTTLSLDFTDDFFATIRSMYNARSTNPALNRLSFVLIGVATPNDLMADPKRTPFNIGVEMDVSDFTLEDALPLADGFEMDAKAAQAVLEKVLAWTGGHPYLTQRLCSVIASAHLATVSQADVDQAVAAAFFGEQSERDANLRFVQDMLVRRAADQEAVLQRYRDIIRGRVVTDDRQSEPITHLKLSGVVVRRGGQLVVRNRIYQHVFDRKWMDRQMPVHWIKSVPPAVIGLVAASFIAVILLGVMLRQAERTSQAEKDRAEQEALNTELARQIEIQDSLAAQLRSTLALVEVQRDSSETLRQAGVLANQQLTRENRRAEALRLEADVARDSTEIALEATRRAQADLQATLAQSQALRDLAEQRLDETRAARRETLTLALADASKRQARRGDAELAALLARQAYVLSGRGSSFYLDPVFESLVSSLNALGEPTGVRLGGPQVFAVPDGAARSTAFSADGRLLAVGAEGGTVIVSSLAQSGAPRSEWSANVGSSDIRSVIFYAGSDQLLTVTADGTIQSWDVDGGARQRPTLIGRQTSAIRAAVLTSDGSRLATSGMDGVVRIWDVQTRTQTTEQAIPGAWIGAMAFKPNGDLLIGGRDGKTWIWPGQGAMRPDPLVVSTGDVTALAVSDDGSHWAVGTQDGDVVAMEPAPNDTFAPRHLSGHSGPVNAVTFVGSNNRLATASGDHTALVWDLANPDRAPILLEDHDGWIWAISASTDGSVLATGGSDRSVRVWSLDVAALAERVCAVVSRSGLTDEEWTSYVGADFDQQTDRASCPTSMSNAESRSNQ